MIPREAVDGVVRHPLSGAVEFTSTDDALAKQVAATLDERAPVDEVAELTALYAALSPAQRKGARWVMPMDVWRRLVVATTCKESFWSYTLREPSLLLGLPYDLDGRAAGISLRVQGSAR